MTEPGKEKQEIEAKKQIVLVVDGRPMRQFYTSIFLQRLKYHVIMAKTAADGFTFMDLTVPLIVIVNIDLPDMTGLDLLKRVKQNPRTRNVPVVIYTSNKDPRIQMECEQAGCAGYLRHPVPSRNCTWPSRRPPKSRGASSGWTLSSKSPLAKAAVPAL